MDDDGFEPKCKLCNCKFQNEIEDMRENNGTYEQIKNFLEHNGEDISLMAISRHFNKHYPTKKEQIEGKKLQNQKKQENNKKIILKTVASFPYLKELFSKEVYWETKLEKESRINKSEECLPKTFKDVFLYDYGYCTSGYKFCENVPKMQVYCVSDALFKLDMELSQNPDKNSNLKLNLVEKQTKCANCVAFYNDCFNEFLLYSMLQSIFGNELIVEDVKRSFIENFECDHQKTYNSLMKSSKRSEA